MIAIYINSNKSTIKHIVLAEDSFMCFRKILLYYKRHKIKGQPIRINM